MSVCGPWRFRVRSESGGMWQDFVPEEWELDFRRSTAGETQITVSDCPSLVSADGGCDRLEAWCGDDLAAVRVIGEVAPDQGTIDLGSESATVLLDRRRWPKDRTLSGRAGVLWGVLWSEANAIAPTGLTAGVASGGPRVSVEVQTGDLMDGTLDRLSTYVTWAEFGGELQDWLSGSEPHGRVLDGSWIVRSSCPAVGEFDSRSVANDLLFRYGPQLDNSLRFRTGGDGCVAQSGSIDFPEITTRAQMLELANIWGPVVSAAEPVLDNIEVDPAATRLIDLMPGVWHRSALDVHAGYDFNLASAVLTGRFECVESVTVGFDQGDNDIRRRLLS